MAVSRDYDKINIILDAYATQFAIDFDVNTDDYGNAINIKVYLGLDELTQNVDYTISKKTVNYPDAVNHAGEKLTIYRDTPIEQPVDFVDNGNFTLEDIEAMGDRAIMILQEQGVNLADTINAQESALRAEQYKDIAIEKASDAEDWAVGTRSDERSPQHSSESSKHYAEEASSSASAASTSEANAETYKLVSEGWAVGKQDGADVGSTSPYYQNNSKYYSDYTHSIVDAHATALTYLDTHSANIDTVVSNVSDINTVANNITDVSTVATDISDVNTVAGDISDVSAVAGSIGDISSVAGGLTDIGTVAADISDVSTVAGDIANVNTVAGNTTNINAVASNETNINTVATDISDVSAVAGDMANVNSVAGDLTNIDTVAGIDTDVTTVATNISDVSTVATDIADVGAVATNISDVTAVADDLTNIDAVAGDLTNIDIVAGDKANIDAVAGNKTNIDTVAGDKANIDAVAGNKTNIDTVAGISSDVTTVAGISSNVTTVAGDKTNIDTVAGDKANIDTVATNISDVGTVATNISDVGTVSTNISDINTIVSNLSDILSADDYASLSRQYGEGKHLDGTDVSSGEAGYHNNSKYYLDQTILTIAGVLRYKGTWTTTSQTDYSSIGTPRSKGDMYYCQGSATIIDGVTYTQGDLIIFNQDVASGTTITTSMIDKIDNTETVTPDNTATLKNKTINIADNTLVGVQPTLSTAQQSAVDSGITSAKVGNYDSHLSNTSNPHGVTKAQVGLGNCDNTADADKPISTATQTALDGKQATIDSSHKLSSDLVDDTSATNKFVTASDKTTWNGKQSALDTTQMAAVNSGITSTLVGKISTNESAISTINGKIPSAASSTNQLTDKSYVDTGLSGKQATITGGATTIVSDNLTANRALRSGSDGKVKVSSVTQTELEYLSGVTSAIQTQLNGKQAAGSYVTTSRKVNGKALSSDITLSASDVSALPSSTVIPTVVDTYSATGTDAVSGKAVASAISGKQDALSTAQINAANSGITSTKVGNYDTHIADTGIHVTSSDKSTWNGKQSALDTTQMAAVNSGINSTLVGKMVTTDDSQTLTNKTVDKASNTVTTSPLEINTTPYTLTPTKEMNVVITGTSVALTLGNGPYDGYSLPILAKKDCTVTYTGAGGATFTDTIMADWYVHYIWRGNWLREMSITMSGTGSDGTSLGTLYVLTRR